MKTRSTLISADNAQPEKSDSYNPSSLSCDIFASETIVLLSMHDSLIQPYMKLLSGQDLGISGSLTILQKESAHYSKKERLHLHTKIAYVLQGNSLLSATNAYNNLTLAALYHQHGSQDEIDTKALKLLRQMPDQSQLDNLPADMSELLKRHLSLSRPLMLDPLALFIEQPFIGLSHYEKVILEKYIAKIKQDYSTTLIISTDELLFARKHADKIIYCDEKNVLLFDNWESFYKSPQESISELFKIQRIKRETYQN